MIPRPLSDRVVVRKLPRPDRDILLLKDSLLVLPERRAPGEVGEDASEHYGEVVAVGPGRVMKEGTVYGKGGKFLHADGRRRPMNVSVGERVWWGRFCDWEDDEHAMIMEKDIIGIEDRGAAVEAGR